MTREQAEVARAIGRYLAGLRASFGLSLSQAAELLAEEGVDGSVSTLSRAERGETILRVDVLQALVERLGGTMDELAEIVRAARAAARRGGRVPPPGDPDRARRHARELLEGGRAAEAMRLLEELVRRARRDGDAARAGDPRLAAAVLVDLGEACVRLRMYRRGLRVLAEALNSGALDEEERIRALLLCVTACDRTGDHHLATLYAQRALELAGKRKGTWLHAHAHAVVGSSHQLREECEAAVAHYLEALRGFEWTDGPFRAAQVRVALGQCLARIGRTAQGRALLRRAMREARAMGWRTIELAALEAEADAALAAGEWHLARARYHEAATIARALGRETELFLALHGLWKVARHLGDESASRREEAAMRRLLPAVDPGFREVREFRRRMLRARQAG